ncbi:phage integrase family protein [Gillisia sp. Hel_I_86]|uniref:tyrosine-type recombinase/integrase n=1 Tax=Gillisia sp. Hel_I_86 TaxID=1249981 RepID=UPI001199A080|nr:tyrosine-type recombinase/integrase [Gillisia sp. Hel_I_86]TVZ26700.1 phage integrase family protein [Gillisia sp. Hel_I_86]
MASIKYRIKTSKDWNSIYLRFKQGKQFDLEISTGIQAPKGRWSKYKEEILPTIEMDYRSANLKLKELKNYVRSEFENTRLNGHLINSKWLKEKIYHFFNRETLNAEIDDRLFFTNYIDRFIKASHNKKTRNNTPVKKRTIQHYTTTKNKILAFEEYQNKRLRFEDINLQFHSNFIDFLETEQLLNPNTIGGYIDDIKLFCSNADKRNYDVPKDFQLSDFYSPSNKTKDIYLNEEEINSIYCVDLEYEYLDNARDWLVIGLRTGFRVSDFLSLTNKNIENGFITKNTKKTDFPVIIPIHDQVQEILNKRGGELPRKISDQKFNDYIKKVAKKAGLTELTEGAKMSERNILRNGKKVTIHRKEYGSFKKYKLVTSHICRRSFATNLYGKIDTLTIMKITGHKTEKQFLDYIKVTPKEYAEKLKNFWLKQKS